MSFSGDVKNELGRQYGKSRHCQIAELAGILSVSGRYEDKKFVLESDNPCVIEKYAVLLQKAFSFDITQPVDEELSEKIRSALRFENGVIDALLLQRTCCKRAFIRGAFMAAGSISNPHKSYHFEIVCKSMEFAILLQNQMLAFEADAKIVERKKHFIVFFKNFF